jgi:hypothetical protein
LNKVPNQRIVPFVEDHRNVLILTPVKPLTISAMATLQAALKRGIERTFQIEEAELVVEPLPRADNRQALLFYEAAEGGAGVLNRLISEPANLSLVAKAALNLMHFENISEIASVEQLSDKERKNADGTSICEAGCYQCLLSYFNQPDHSHIDRRNLDALSLLYGLTNTSTTPFEVQSKFDSQPGTENNLLSIWLSEIQLRNLKQPDEIEVSINQGQATAAGRYKN